MGLILSIETAISVCSVAIHDEGKLLALNELYMENAHAQKLMPAVKGLLDQVGKQVSDLAAIAVSQGPGSYTGLRIGVSTAKGLAFAHDLPLIAVDTLDALARRAKGMVREEDRLVPMIDARRMEVYAKVFSGSLEELVPLRPVVIDEASFREEMEQSQVYFLGDAVDKVQVVIQHPNAYFLPWGNTAATVGEIAFEKYSEQKFSDLAYFEPNYLKEFRVVKSKKNPLLL